MTAPEDLHLTQAPHPVSSAAQIGARDTLPSLFTETGISRRNAKDERTSSLPTTVAWIAILGVCLLVTAAIWALFAV